MNRHFAHFAVVFVLAAMATSPGRSSEEARRFLRDDQLHPRNDREVVDAAGSWHVSDHGLSRLRSYVLRGEIDVYMQNRIRRLLLDGTRITDKGLKHFEGRDGLIFLEELSLADTQITDAGLNSLVGLDNLQRIDLGRTYEFDGGSCGAHVTAAGISKLRRQLNDCRVNHERVTLTLSARQLELYRLWTPVAEVRMNNRGDMIGLLIRREKQLTAAHYESLVELKQLKELDAGGSFSGNDVRQLAQVPWIQELGLSGCRLSEQEMKSLSLLKELRVLDLSQTQLTDAGLTSLHSARNLKTLDVRETEVHTKGLQRLSESLPELSIVFDPWRVVQVRDRRATVNDRFELLSVGGGYFRNKQGRPTRRLAGRLTALLKHPTLESLSLRHSAVTDDDLTIVARMQNLKELDLGNTNITAAGVQHLGRLEKLEKLNLWSTKIGHESGISALAGLSRLQSLELDETRIDDEAILALIRLPGLKYTELWHTRITPAGVAKLRKARPDLTVRYELRR